MQVSVNLTVAKKKLSQSNVKRGRFALANQAMADMNQFVPMREGILRQTGTVDSDGSAVTYGMPYAKAQFYGRVGRGGYPVRNYTTPGTGPRWDLKAKPIFMSDWIKAFVKGADW
ncbi:hypothetical protein J1TS1_28100 [Shouchella clausii]|uniref:minor capsid protein n=1 Tax=Shouchella clausii TaxID=79880 RepID=UPI001B07837A|nr:minor capsid protein [Shouchella clausii]GIN08665.1 hypothetical protein J1TS1_28100 [Shouchella clausii]